MDGCHLFQFAPPHGGDRRADHFRIKLSGFQFAPPHGGDRGAGLCDRHQRISIRAPAWGRRSSRPTWTGAIYFNSRPRMGATVIKVRDHIVFEFQFAPPHGGDSQPGRLAPTPRNFNSRPRMGATWGASLCDRHQGISIRAPAWGRRQSRGRSARSLYFNSRPRMGATWTAPFHSLCGRWDFNSRPRMGATWGASLCDRHQGISIRAPAWGRLGRQGGGGVLMSEFQFAPPHGGDEGGI